MIPKLFNMTFSILNAILGTLSNFYIKRNSAYGSALNLLMCAESSAKTRLGRPLIAYPCSFLLQHYTQKAGLPRQKFVFRQACIFARSGKPTLLLNQWCHFKMCYIYVAYFIIVCAIYYRVGLEPTPRNGGGAKSRHSDL